MFAIRTVQNGRVRIAGRWFYPSNILKKYDGRFDGLRYCFALYYTGETLEPYVFLWGTEEAYKTTGYDDEIYPWIWWWVKKGADDD